MADDRESIHPLSIDEDVEPDQVGFAIAGCGLQCAQAGDLKITIPKRSKLTPVQRLNREGVEAIRKHNYSKAEQSFYKATAYALVLIVVLVFLDLKHVGQTILAISVVALLAAMTKEELKHDLLARFGSLFMIPGLHRLKVQIDWEEHRAAPLLDSDQRPAPVSIGSLPLSLRLRVDTKRLVCNDRPLNPK